MAINLKKLQPHKISRDLSGYITYLYGPGGSGKTTFGVQTKSPLLLAFERGYNALGGKNVIPQDITTWGEMKQVLRQLDDPEVKDMFQTIVVDTVDKAVQLCEKYVCSQLGIENIGDGGWGTNSWKKVKLEWEQTFNSITMKGYSVIFISHSKEKTIKRKDGTEYTQIVPSCPNAYNEIIRNMVDIEGYIDVNNNERHLILRSPDDSVECKSRFKYMSNSIPFSYKDLVSEMNRAIDEEAAHEGQQYTTEDRETIKETTTYDFNSLMEKFQDYVGQLMQKNQAEYGPKVTYIIDKYLGKGKKISEATLDQAELVSLIVTEIKEDLIDKLT